VCDQSVKSHSREVDGLEGPIYDEFRDGQPRRRGLLNSVTAKTCGKVQIRVTGMGPYHTIRVETIVLVKASPRAFHLKSTHLHLLRLFPTQTFTLWNAGMRWAKRGHTRLSKKSKSTSRLFVSGSSSGFGDSPPMYEPPSLLKYTPV
jgi:hypothetical protein